MKVLRMASAAALAMLAIMATAAPAQANFAQQFMANSGDNCRYGATQGTLFWRYSTTAPIRPISIEVRGSLVDHPLPNENFLCRDDRFYTVATFTAFSSTPMVAAVRADNEIIAVNLLFGPGAPSTAGFSRLTVQVCRYPLPSTQPPVAGYCGVAQHYAPVVWDPPPPR